jgi:hypothetical protein
MHITHNDISVHQYATILGHQWTVWKTIPICSIINSKANPRKIDTVFDTVSQNAPKRGTDGLVFTSFLSYCGIIWELVHTLQTYEPSSDEFLFNNFFKRNIKEGGFQLWCCLRALIDDKYEASILSRPSNKYPKGGKWMYLPEPGVTFSLPFSQTTRPLLTVTSILPCYKSIHFQPKIQRHPSYTNGHNYKQWSSILMVNSLICGTKGSRIWKLPLSTFLRVFECGPWDTHCDVEKIARFFQYWNKVLKRVCCIIHTTHFFST